MLFTFFQWKDECKFNIYHCYKSLSIVCLLVVLSREIYNTETSSWRRWCLKSSESWLFAQPFLQAQIKKNIKLRVTGDRWISLTKCQWRGKCFIRWRQNACLVFGYLIIQTNYYTYYQNVNPKIKIKLAISMRQIPFRGSTKHNKTIHISIRYNLIS